MDAWLIGAVIAVLAIGVFAVGSYVNAAQTTDKETISCTTCGNSCTAGNNCGLSTCGAVNGGKCNCGK